MNVFFFLRGRSERSRKKFQFKWLTFIVRLFDVFFGTYSWQLPAAELTTVNSVNFNGHVPIPVLLPEQSVNRLSLFTKRVVGSSKGKIHVFRNGIQLWRSRRKWGLIKTRSDLLISICPGSAQWREVIGRRGPPRALYAEIDTVRLQE